MSETRALDEASVFTTLASGAIVNDGEDVDLLTHMEQCAHLLATRVPGDLELCVAGLVHDVGTLLVPGRPARHADIGARAVSHLLGERVRELVATHDVAKLYLVTTDRRYRARLSSRSLATLEEQGGLLGPDDRARFEASPCFEASLVLREADDDAKVVGAPAPGLESWRDAVAAVALRTRESESSGRR